MQKKILLVEDQRDISKLIRMTLEFENAEIKEATNGQEALSIMETWIPDVILSDVMMPIMDGWTLAKHIRQDQRFNHIKIVFLTARAQENDIKQGKEVGANDYLVKPFSPLKLIDTIDALSPFKQQ